MARRGEGRCGAGDGRNWKQKGGHEVLSGGIFGEERGRADSESEVLLRSGLAVAVVVL